MAAWGGVVSCVLESAALGAHRRVHLRRDQVGRRITFADGTSARIFRETVVDGGPVREPCLLLVAFRLRLVRGWGHAAFRWESLFNTPLFVGFPGLRSKLWLAGDDKDVYRGLYEWESARLAERYARCLWRVLALVCVPGSIHYIVLPGWRRDQVLDSPHVLDGVGPREAGAWWRPVAIS